MGDGLVITLEEAKERISELEKQNLFMKNKISHFNNEMNWFIKQRDSELDYLNDKIRFLESQNKLLLDQKVREHQCSTTIKYVIRPESLGKTIDDGVSPPNNIELKNGLFAVRVIEE